MKLRREKNVKIILQAHYNATVKKIIHCFWNLTDLLQNVSNLHRKLCQMRNELATVSVLVLTSGFSVKILHAHTSSRPCYETVTKPLWLPRCAPPKSETSVVWKASKFEARVFITDSFGPFSFDRTVYWIRKSRTFVTTSNYQV